MTKPLCRVIAVVLLFLLLPLQDARLTCEPPEINPVFHSGQSIRFKDSVSCSIVHGSAYFYIDADGSICFRDWCNESSVIAFGDYVNLQLADNALYVISRKRGGGSGTLLYYASFSRRKHAVAKNVDRYYVFPDRSCVYHAAGTGSYYFWDKENGARQILSCSAPLSFQGEDGFLMLYDTREDEFFFFTREEGLCETRLAAEMFSDIDILDCCMNEGATCFLFNEKGVTYASVLPNDFLMQDGADIRTKGFTVPIECAPSAGRYLITYRQKEVLEAGGFSFPCEELNETFCLVSLPPDKTGMIMLDGAYGILITEENASSIYLEERLINYSQLYPDGGFEREMIYFEGAEDEAVKLSRELIENDMFLAFNECLLARPPKCYNIDFFDMSIEWHCLYTMEYTKWTPIRIGSETGQALHRFCLCHGYLPFARIDVCGNSAETQAVIYQQMRYTGGNVFVAYFNDMQVVYDYISHKSNADMKEIRLDNHWALFIS